MWQQSTNAQTNECVDLLRMGEVEIKRILRNLDEMGREGVGVSHCKSQRQPYRKKRVIVQLQGINNLSAITYRMMPSDISSTGISLVHGAFVYPGTPCIVTLTAIDGESTKIPGKVVRCRLITGRAHELGTKFSNAIDLRNFVASPLNRK